MGALMRSHDWASTSLGPPEQWPQALRTTVRLMLNTGHPMYIFWGESSVCLYNDAYSKSIGPEHHPISLGMLARDVWDETWQVIGPQIAQVLQNGEATWHVNQLIPITRHGSLEDVYWTYSYSPIDDDAAPAGVGGVLVVCTETTEQVLASKAHADATEKLAQSTSELEAERVRLQTIVDTIPTGLIMLDQNGAFLIENAEWKRTWAGNGIVNGVVDYDSYKGFDPATGERIGATDWPCAISLKQGIKTHDVVIDIERFDGTPGTIVVSSAPIRDNTGRVIAAIAANMDITNERIAQTQLQKANQRQTEFLATLAHELRNPLAPIRSGLAVLGLSGDSAKAIAKVRGMMERQVGHMVHLIDELLDVARISGGKLQLMKAPADLRTVLASAVETSLPLIEAGDHELRVDVPQQPVLADIDVDRIAQIVANLLNNAAKYTPSGGKIDLVLRCEEDSAFISVSDTGIGIPADAMSHVFEMFAQIRHSHDRTQGGLGIGLSLARRLAEMHGGSVSAHSRGSGMGSSFIVRLPLFVDENSKAPPATEQDSGDTPRGVAGLDVLVVDDNIDAATTLSMLLEMYGHKVRVAHNGIDALHQMKQSTPQVVFLDIGMPQMDGYQTARIIRQTEELKQTFVIALTGWGAQEDRKRTTEAGFNSHLTKPVQITDIERIFANLDINTWVIN
jgi:signal transduction histidine kinase